MAYQQGRQNGKSWNDMTLGEMFTSNESRTLMLVAILGLVIGTLVVAHNNCKHIDRIESKQNEQIAGTEEWREMVMANLTAIAEQLDDIIALVTLPPLLVRQASMGIGPAFGEYLSDYNTQFLVQDCDTAEPPLEMVTVGCAIYAINGSVSG